MKSKFSSKTVLSAAVFAALFSTTASADRLTKGEAIAECKTLINEQFEEVKNVKLAHIKSGRKSYTAKFKVTADGERARFTCTVDGEDSTQLVRTDKPANSEVAGGE